MLESKYVQFFSDLIRKLVKQEIKNLNFTNTYPATVVAVSSNNSTADVKIAGDDTSTLTGLLNKSGEFLVVGEQVYIYALNNNLTNAFIGLRKGTPSTSQSWQTPSLLNSWLNYGGGYSNIGFRKNSLGKVEFRGLVKSGIIGSDIFVLPVGCRPLSKIMLNTIANNAIARVDIEPDGSVIPIFGSNVWINFNNLNFPTT